jgi:hypothetical protein
VYVNIKIDTFLDNELNIFYFPDKKSVLEMTKKCSCIILVKKVITSAKAKSNKKDYFVRVVTSILVSYFQKLVEYSDYDIVHLIS